MYFISTYKDLKCDVYINNCIELSWVQVDVVCADKKCITSSCFSDVHHTSVIMYKVLYVMLNAAGLFCLFPSDDA